MKSHFLFTGFLLVGFLGAGCQQSIVPLSRGTSVPPATGIPVIPTAQDATTTNVYEKWMIPFASDNDLRYLLDTSQNGSRLTDCVGVTNGDTHDGDLLSSLIADPRVGKFVSLKVYTPEYIKSLEKRLTDYTRKEHQADLYAFYVCHLGKNMDAVAGYLWPQGTKARGLNSMTNGTLLIATSNNVREYGGIQLITNTATGGEVSPCDAKLIDATHVQWSCFQGLEMGTTSTHSRMQYWLLDLTGGPLKTWKKSE